MMWPALEAAAYLLIVAGGVALALVATSRNSDDD
jgi:hypothetical protein